MLIDGYLTFKETVALWTVSYTVVLDHEMVHYIPGSVV